MRSLTTFVCLLAAGLTAPARGGLVPILDMKTGAVLGGVRGGTFVMVATVVKALRGNEKFRFYGPEDAHEGEVIITKLFRPDPACSDFYHVRVEPHANTGVMIGTGATWNPTPRLPQTLWAGPGNRFWNNPLYITKVARSRDFSRHGASTVRSSR